MARITNPSYELKIFLSAIEPITEQYIEFEVSKDLETEPNEAVISIFNLNADTRDKMVSAGDSDAPIELYATPSGSEELVLVYRGEVDYVDNNHTRPGWETILNCKSQQSNNRDRWIDEKTFIKGTTTNDIVNFFIEQIGLPSQITDIDSTPILLAESYTGPAFSLLKAFIEPKGYKVYISDGTIYISDIYDPNETTVTEILLSQLLQKPLLSSRKSRSDVQVETIVEKNTRSPLRKKRRKKRKNKTVKQFGASDYVEYDVVNQSIDGVELELTLKPDILPDRLISIEGNDNIYRIQTVIHHGESEFFSDWTTEIEADIYEPETL